MSKASMKSPGSGDRPSADGEPLVGPGFQVVLASHVTGAAKTQKTLATAIARLEKAKARLRYFESLATYAHGVELEKVQPSETEYSAALEKEIRLFDAWYDKCPHRLSKSLRKLLREILVWKLEEVVFQRGMRQLEPLLHRHAPPPSLEEQSEMLGAARDLMESMTGVKFDQEDFRPNMGPADFARLEEKYGEQLQNAVKDGPFPSRKKTKKQLAAEAQRKQAEELLDRDLNRLFKDLVLKLHPDREQDPALRLEKEEIMKSLIRARDEGDYTELLRMHVQVHGASQGADRPLFSEGTVKTLSRLLGEKTRTVELEIYSLRASNPLLGQGLRFTQILMTDQKMILQAAQGRAASFRQLTRHTEETLALYQRDAQAFFRYLRSRPHEADLDDDWEFEGDLWD